MPVDSNTFSNYASDRVMDSRLFRAYVGMWTGRVLVYEWDSREKAGIGRDYIFKHTINHLSSFANSSCFH